MPLIPGRHLGRITVIYQTALERKKKKKKKRVHGRTKSVTLYLITKNGKGEEGRKKIALAADGFSSSGGKLINNSESEGLASRDTQNNSFKGSFPSLIPD
ncbi:hypothetical protein CEXT_162921 [Caerostris extrusa]|uniref:Uncharacterized protein n=1 Tax=Caerostris extrusa TaxID=172846 RepID=A0AAV4V5L7_CAEEX|nr:hypothetical protein CEXT_162921 [Caerostris extrusa]